MKSRFKRCQVVYGNADYNLCIYYKCNYVCKDFSFLTGDYIISIYYLYVYIYVYTSTFQVLGPRPPRTHTQPVLLLLGLLEPTICLQYSKIWWNFICDWKSCYVLSCMSNSRLHEQ